MKLKRIVIATLAMSSMATAVAETRSVGGAAYLLSMPKDISEDFLGMEAKSKEHSFSKEVSNMERRKECIQREC